MNTLETMPVANVEPAVMLQLLQRMPVSEAIITMLELPEVFGPLTVGGVADFLGCSLKTLANNLAILAKSERVHRVGPSLILGDPSLARTQPEPGPKSARAWPDDGPSLARSRPEPGPKSGNTAIDTNNTNSGDVLLGVGGVGGGVFKALEPSLKTTSLKALKTTREKKETTSEWFAQEAWARVKETDGADPKLDMAAWEAWMQNMQERREKFGLGRIRFQIKKLLELSNSGESQMAIIGRAIEGRWQMFYPNKPTTTRLEPDQSNHPSRRKL